MSVPYFLLINIFCMQEPQGAGEDMMIPGLGGLVGPLVATLGPMLLNMVIGSISGGGAAGGAGAGGARGAAGAGGAGGGGLGGLFGR